MEIFCIWTVHTCDRLWCVQALTIGGHSSGYTSHYIISPSSWKMDPIFLPLWLETQIYCDPGQQSTDYFYKQHSQLPIPWNLGLNSHISLNTIIELIWKFLFIELHVLAGLKVQPWEVVEKMLKHYHRSTHPGLMTSASHAVTFTGAYKPFQVQGREVFVPHRWLWQRARELSLHRWKRLWVWMWLPRGFNCLFWVTNASLSVALVPSLPVQELSPKVITSMDAHW